MCLQVLAGRTQAKTSYIAGCNAYELPECRLKVLQPFMLCRNGPIETSCGAGLSAAADYTASSALEAGRV